MKREIVGNREYVYELKIYDTCCSYSEIVRMVHVGPPDDVLCTSVCNQITCVVHLMTSSQDGK